MDENWFEDMCKAFDVESRGPAAQVGDSAEVASNKAGTATIQKAKAFDQNMYEEYPDSVKRAGITNAVKAFVGQKLKLGTTEVGPLLVNSVAPRYAWIRNEETQTLNIVESAPGPEIYVDSYVREIVERRQGKVRAAQVNPEAAVTTTPTNSVREQKFNATAFWGDLVEVTFIVAAQAGEQKNLSVEMEEMDSVLLSISKAINYDLLNGIRQMSFAGTNIPTIGGLGERILSNTDTAGTADISDAVLRPLIRKVQRAVGSQLPKLLICNMRQCEVIWGLHRGLWSGNDPMSYFNYYQELGKRLKDAGVMIDKIYEPGVGPPIGVVHDEDAGTNMFLLTLTQMYWPQMAYFRIGGKKGPWAFVRPVYDLKRSVFCMHGASFDDPGEESRALVTNVLQS